MKENRNYQLDHSLRVKSTDLVDQSHMYDLNLKSNHVFLMGVDRGYELDSNDEPGVDYVMANRFIKNFNLCMRVNPGKPILIHMKTCFSRKTLITTDKGYKKISDIVIGDRVLTHTGEYHKVIDTMSQMHDGDMIKLYYGRSKNNTTSITATADHPVLVETGGIKKWISMNDIKNGDVIYVEARKCSISGENIPYWKTVKNYNAERLINVKNSPLTRKFESEILKQCDILKKAGWTVVPTDMGVRPDIVGFKDGKITLFEIENMKGKSLEVKKDKYKEAPVLKYIDNIIWITPDTKSYYSWYEASEIDAFVKVKVTGIKKWKNKYKQRVYNITVDKDNSYVANRVVVHNCGGNWEEGMAIYNTIRSCEWPVTILNYTHARSMSSIIFQAANKRVMMPDSYFMFHMGTSAVEGTAKQVRSAIEFDKKENDKRMLEIYVQNVKKAPYWAGKTDKFIRNWIKNEMDKREDVYLNTQDTVKYGFADSIFDYNWADLMKYSPEELER